MLAESFTRIRYPSRGRSLTCRMPEALLIAPARSLHACRASNGSGSGRFPGRCLLPIDARPRGNGESENRQIRAQKTSSKTDIELLAGVDEAHDTLSGPATQEILNREFHEFDDERMAAISVAHIYNLRKRRAYRERRIKLARNRPTKVSIGERRRPEPEGRAPVRR
jgi:hypothetical protein